MMLNISLSFGVFLLLFCPSCTSVDTSALKKRNYGRNNNLKRNSFAYLEEKAKDQGVITLESGMLVEILKKSDRSDAKSPLPGDSCEVTYSGTLTDGTPFDAGTTSFAPDQVIMGWNEAMQLMVEGDKWKLHVPYNLAYGARGYPPKIPPFSTLVFDIEIHKVKSGKGKSVASARNAFERAKRKSFTR